MTKQRLYVIGIITLLVFPIPTLIWEYYFEGSSIEEIFDVRNFQLYPILLGLGIGIIYAFIAQFFMRMDFGAELPKNIERMFRRMKLTILDCLFISFCAGFGEELLFRVGVQEFLGPIITSILFVAIHGYLNPFNWRISIYGLIVLPFIFILAYGYKEFGLWFAIAAHMSYDYVLFRIMSRSTEEY